MKIGMTAFPRRSRTSRVLMIQCAIACLVLAVVTLAPPARGSILIVSLSGEGPDEIARWASARDARLIAVGPGKHSLVVTGSRAALWSAAARHGGLLISGMAAGCGKASAR
jgi:hypothetical protein